MLELRKHQWVAVDKVEFAIAKGERRIMLQAPIAFGKTACAAQMIYDRAKRGERSLFIAPALSLIDQTVERFQQYGLDDIGVIQADHPMTDSRRLIQVASVQTLMRRKVPDFSLGIIDEAHLRYLFLSRTMQREAYANIPFVGLSATPWSTGLGLDYSKLIVAGKMATMARGGWLKKLRYYCPIEIDASNIRIVAGEYHEGELSKLSSGKTILSNTVKEWIERASDRPTIAFCVDRAHAQALQSRFMLAGVACGYIDGNTDALERARIGSQLRSGEIKLVTSVGCLIAGIDWTFVNCILFCVKTKSRIKWVQAVGRGMRLHDGQEDCLLLDCAGNQKLGHPYDIHQEWLDDGKKEAKEKRKQQKDEQQEARKCAKCEALMPAGVHICPECGFEPKKQTEVIDLNAPMREIGVGGKTLSTSKFYGPDRQLWYSSFKAIANARKYANGWAARQYKEKFGEWPDKGKIHDIAIDNPAPEVSSWVQHRMIKWAKSRKNK